MEKLSFNDDDRRYLRAAEGWLELGDGQSANDELENIRAQLRAHPQVLALRWQVYAHAGNWDVAVELSGLLLPHQSKREASETMYLLACHACRLNRIEDARHWIDRAIAKDDSTMKLRALDDPKLNAVWTAL